MSHNPPLPELPELPELAGGSRMVDAHRHREEVKRLTAKFSYQVQKERQQTASLVENLSGALGQFQKQLDTLKGVKKNERARLDRRVTKFSADTPAHLKPKLDVSKSLLEAAKQYHLELCRSILAEHADFDVDYADSLERTAMHHLLLRHESQDCAQHLAKEEKEKEEEEKEVLLDVLTMLIEQGGNVNKRMRDGRTPLYLACVENELEIIECFINTKRPTVLRGRVVEGRSRHRGELSEPEVVSEGVSVASRLELLANPNLVFTTPDGEKKAKVSTPWHVALDKKSTKMLNLLCEAQTHLHNECYEYMIMVNSDALSPKSRPGRKNRKRRGSISAVVATANAKRKQLFPDGVPEGVPDDERWFYDFDCGDPNTWCKQTNASGNPMAWQEHGSPLHLAVAKAEDEHIAFEMLEILVKRQPLNEDRDSFCTLFDPNALDHEGRNPLHLACEKGYEKAVEALIQYRHCYGEDRGAVMVDINAQETTHQLTPLMSAIRNGHENAVKKLFERNSLALGNTFKEHDLALRCSHSHQTALHLACAHKIEQNEVVLELCQHKAEVNLKDEHGASPLHLATMRGHVMIVKTLLKYNANAAAMEKHGKETALHIAAAFGHISILNVLLRKGGAEVLAENSERRTPLHHAFRRHMHLSSLAEKAVREAQEKNELAANSNPGIQDQIDDQLKVLESRRSRALRKSTDREQRRLQARNDKFTSSMTFFDFEKHPDSPHQDLYARLNNLENLFVAINNQNMLIKLLLDNGGDLEQEDTNGDPAFEIDARLDWFDTHYDEMTEIYDHPNEMGYDSEIFTDKRTQVAVRTRWISSGQRTRAIRDLFGWFLYLGLLTAVAMRYSGGHTYEAAAMQYAIEDRLDGDEWDEVEVKNLADVGQFEDWHLYLQQVLLPALWETGAVSFDADGARVEHRNALLNGQLALLGRPRYRQIRTRPESCEPFHASLVPDTDDFCFQGGTQGSYRSTAAWAEDRTPVTCPLSDGTELKLEWEDKHAYPVAGSFGFYSRVGVSLTLPEGADEAAQLFDDLEACNFISLNTRAAIIDFTLYSRSQQLFTDCHILLESTSSGGIVARSKYETRRLASYGAEAGYGWVVEVVWLVWVLRYFLDEFTAMTKTWDPQHILEKKTPMWWWWCIMDNEKANSRTIDDPKRFQVLFTLPEIFCVQHSLCLYRTDRYLSPYWINPFNYVDVLIMSLIVILLSLHGRLCWLVSGELQEWQHMETRNEFVDTANIMWLASFRQHVLASVVFLCYIKCLEYLQVSARLAIPVIIIGGMLYQLASFFMIFAVFIVAFALFDFVLYGLASESNRTIFRSVVYNFRAAMGDLDFDARAELDQVVAVLMTCVAGFLLIILLLNLLVAVMNEAYDEIKDSAEARWCYMQFRMIVENERKPKNQIDKLSKDLTKAAGHAVDLVSPHAAAEHHHCQHHCNCRFNNGGGPSAGPGLGFNGAGPMPQTSFRHGPLDEAFEGPSQGHAGASILQGRQQHVEHQVALGAWLEKRRASPGQVVPMTSQRQSTNMQQQ